MLCLAIVYSVIIKTQRDGYNLKKKPLSAIYCTKSITELSTHSDISDTTHVTALPSAAYHHLLPICDSTSDVLTKVFISADSSLVTTANFRKAAPISGSWSLLSALPPSLSRDRDRYISLSTCAAKRETTRQFVHPRKIL